MSNASLILGWRDRWNRSLLLFLRRRVHSAIDIDDLAQETYLRLLRARDLSDVRNPQAYLLKIAGHVVAEWRDRLPPEQPLALTDEDVPTGQGNPEQEMDGQISQSHFDRALKECSPMLRAILVLRFRDERSYKEIASVLQLTNRQVRRHLLRGFELLRHTFEG